MPRRFIKCINNKIGYNYQGISFKNVVVRESTPVDEFYFEETIASKSQRKCVAFTDPIRMLFNQKRLDRIGNTAVQAWLDSLANYKTDPLAELRGKCSDADLKALIKSRHIQQPCEIVAWAKECSANMELFNSELKKLQEAQLAEQKALENNVQPDKTE